MTYSLNYRIHVNLKTVIQNSEATLNISFFLAAKIFLLGPSGRSGEDSGHAFDIWRH